MTTLANPHGTKEDTDMETLVEVTQADRDAAAALVDREHGNGNYSAEQGFRSGESDDHSYVQAFARHRLDAERLSSPTEWPADAEFPLGAAVEKKGRAKWRGRVVGWYRTELTALGYAVESEFEPGSVQIYPATALVAREAIASSPTEMREAIVEALDTFEKLAADLREEDAERHAQRIAVIEIDITRLRAALERSHTTKEG